jgi:hypothetical protein
MSDESSRSARPYGQRRNDGAPIWWAALDRADLPDGEVLPEAHRRWYEDTPSAASPELEVVARPHQQVRHYRGWLISLLVAVGIAVVLCGALLIDPTGYVLTITLLIGIPVGLAALVTIFVVRRSS